YKLFGINAEILIDHSWGLEPCLMKDIKSYKSKNSSLSSNQVLPRPYKFTEAEIIVKEMSDMLCLDLVRKNLVTESVTLYVGFDHASAVIGYDGPSYIDHYGRIIPQHAGGTFRFSTPTNSAKEITKGFLTIFNDENRVNRNLLIRRVGVCANKISANTGCYQLELFRDYEKEAKENNLQHTLLQIKSKYGSNSILKGTNFFECSRTKERNSQIGGHRA
ncbi:MAG: DNA methylase, partial [Candidatus Riflebacteria bacterium]|nr:DNA methylase [Candidatus Riflebacteria bacterium]